MANFQPKKIISSEINGGQRFNSGDGVTPNAINAPIEAALYAQDVADKNEYDINILYEIAEQKGLYAVEEIEQAYVSRVTANGANIVDGQKTPVMLIKGSTVKSNNLIPYPYYHNTQTVNGVTFTDNGDGSITVNGTATANAYFYFTADSVSGLCTISSGDIVSFGKEGNTTILLGIAITPSGATAKQYKNTTSFMSYTAETETVINYVYMVVDSGVVCNNVIIRPMLNEGSTALPYQPYFTDLKRAYFKGIKSTGRNLIPFPYYGGNSFISNGITFITQNDGGVAISGTSSASAYYRLAYNITFHTGTYTISGGRNSVILNIFKNNVWLAQSFDGNAATFTVDNETDVYTVNLYVYSNVTVNTTIYPMLNEGSTTLPYEHYVEENYQLPESIELGEYDSFNPQTGELTRQTGWLSRSWAFTEEELDGYDSPIVSASGTIVAYKLATPTVTKIEGVPKSYTVYNQGSETVIQGEVDNSEYGAMPTITNEYIIIV